ncbi:hypothetical protein V6N13_066864 [Hibiscus sabdariffa]|uniref:Uncharacterized protein n=1 Tax=Hibiscus sabdariffa TaxID=183260 RepID=A0ABR2DRR5_9ROSI
MFVSEETCGKQREGNSGDDFPKNLYPWQMFRSFFYRVKGSMRLAFGNSGDDFPKDLYSGSFYTSYLDFMLHLTLKQKLRVPRIRHTWRWFRTMEFHNHPGKLWQLRPRLWLSEIILFH